MARPKNPHGLVGNKNAQKDISEEEVYKLAKMGCPTTEIAAWFECTQITIENRFSNIIIKARADLKQSLRRWQLQAAEKGNVVMLIWLGKQMLGQTEPPATFLTEDDSHQVGGIKPKYIIGLTQMNDEFIRRARNLIANTQDKHPIVESEKVQDS